MECFGEIISTELPILWWLILLSGNYRHAIILNNKGEEARMKESNQMKTSVAGISQITNLKSNLEFSLLECFGEIISIKLPILGCLTLRSGILENVIILNNKGEEAKMTQNNQTKTCDIEIEQITNLKSSLEFSLLECFGEIISIKLPILGCLTLRSAILENVIILNNKGKKSRMNQSNQMSLALNSLLRA